jgi:hypothetical protein
MEGGNVLHDGVSMFEPGMPVLSTLTAGHQNNQAMSSAHATSAATAQAAHLAAVTTATYPDYWPETVRALLVHGADWTPLMRAAITDARKSGLTAQQMMLRRYGWGTPPRTESSTRTTRPSHWWSKTNLCPSRETPSGPRRSGCTTSRGPQARSKRWVTQTWYCASRCRTSSSRPPVAAAGDAATATPRTNCGSRFRIPWRARRSSSSGSIATPVQRRPAADRRVGRCTGSSARTSATSDPCTRIMWRTSGTESAQSGKLAVFPVGGWWKNNSAKARVDQPVRYALVVSLRTEAIDVDLYTPVAKLVGIPTAITAQ